jgi:hypothetical protein
LQDDPAAFRAGIEAVLRELASLQAAETVTDGQAERAADRGHLTRVG